MSKPRSKSEIEWLLRYHVGERDKAIATLKTAKFGANEYSLAEYNRIWHSGSASALAQVLGIEGALDEISIQMRANPEDHEQ